MLVTLEESRHLPIGQQSIHPLQEAGVHHVALVQNETYFLVLTPRSSQHLPQILVEIFCTVFVVNLDLEHCQPVHPGNKSRNIGKKYLERVVLPAPETPMRRRCPYITH